MAKKSERFETQPPQRSSQDRIAMPTNLEPDEGLRLMRAFAKNQRRSLREGLINLALALANAEDADD